MTTEAPLIRGHHRGLAHRLTVASLLLIACAASITWSWNTIVPELSGLARFRFAEGLSVALTTLLAGALFEAGRRLVAGSSPFRPSAPEK